MKKERGTTVSPSGVKRSQKSRERERGPCTQTTRKFDTTLRLTSLSRHAQPEKDLNESGEIRERPERGERGGRECTDSGE
uniref:Uncharacterized protein n=1 Tax=Pristionchus pacificus TaxID=54126 RepID=A0A2A6CSA6_PRIPA|eukprot:PDM80966.1 hypothetical protein PRIPAC_35969 [Pristionchus pacificus]